MSTQVFGEVRNKESELALAWREERDYKGKGGVVVVFDGEVQGWVNELRDSWSWRPGCVAVSECGRQWLAVGGDDYHGAENWAELGFHTH
ncbi:hypothetical protein [Microbulbifer sp.]|uniref:hypothetical protein n=1 Tax=Microbulbifer sp. TaxID=1908541 RepID=UPI00258927EB|nr:hypothetical protein [Microbulbifer sp.]